MESWTEAGSPGPGQLGGLKEGWMMVAGRRA